MSSSSDVRSRVLRGGAAIAARPARLDSDLRSTPFALPHTVDARLTDPHLEQVVATALAAAAEQGREEGRAAGYADGLAQAAAEARLTAQQQAQEAAAAEQRREVQLADALAVLHGATAELRQREAVAVTEVEDAVVELALEVARAVLGRELAVAADPGRDALRRALALAPADAPVTARLHPTDLAHLAELHTGHDLTLVADDAVEPGGCVVDTAGRHIDAQITPALERVAAVLR